VAEEKKVSEKSWKLNFESKKHINGDNNKGQPATGPIFEVAEI